LWIVNVLVIYSRCEYNRQKNESINCIMNSMNEQQQQQDVNQVFSQEYKVVIYKVVLRTS